MKSNNTVLVVEDCIVSSLRVNRLMEQALPGCRIMRAQSCFEARLLFRLYDFNLCILDVHLPDGCGLDLIRQTTPTASHPKFIVLTADSEPGIQDRSRECGVQCFLTKPLKTQALQNAIRHLQNQTPPRPPEGVTARFSASLDQVSLLDVLQLKCMSGATTRLELLSSGPGYCRGHLDLDSGQIVHAELQRDTTHPISQGEEALTTFLQWTGGNVVETPLPPAAPRTIHQHWQPLLLSIAQIVDEANMPHRPEHN